MNAYLALARIDRPVGTLLLLWPTLAALWAASNAVPAPLLIGVFALGTFFMRSAGCVVNDLADRNIDGQVSRTKNRPLINGDISVKQALGFLLLLLALAALTLLFLNNLTRTLSVVGLLLAMTYPLFKRFTYLPQVPLGAAFSWGLVMAFAAVQNTVPPEAWLLFIGSLFWIVAYDTLYAMIDRDDDILIGVKSTAILFGNGDRFMVGMLQAIALFIFYLFGQQMEYGLFYKMALFAMAGLFIYQLRIIQDRQADACFEAFRNNQWVGFMLFLGVVFELHFGPLLEAAG
jgi:4-hydroxybenzoate polyprenyltransferase